MMRLNDKDSRQSLQKYALDPSAAGDNVSKAADLLYSLLNDSYACSGNCLETDVNGSRQDVQGIYWRCKELLEKTLAIGPRTEFLVMSVLEQAWTRAKPLILCRLETLMSGGTSPVDQARELETIFANDPYKKIWAEKSGIYASILEQIGFNTDAVDFSDLTSIMDPLLDALSFYDPRGGRPPAILKIRSGPPAASKGRPLIAKSVSLYSSEKALVDAVMLSEQPCMAAFGAVEKTNAQIKDLFHEWIYGTPDERQRNSMRNENLTAEQYLAAPAAHTRIIYLCVRSGGNCWLVALPWRADMYARIGDPKHLYYYGRRASYAPYAIFAKTGPAPPGTTELPALPKNAWPLTQLMDAQSMAWFPAFMDETYRYFFAPGAVPVSKDAAMPEETVMASGPGAAVASARHISGNLPVPAANSGMPVKASYVYGVKPPEELFEQDYMRVLIKRFSLSPSDVMDAPLLPRDMKTLDECAREADEKLRKAYVITLARKIAVFMRARWETRAWVLDRIRVCEDEIITRAGAGDFMSFMGVTVAGTPVLNPDGSPKMIRRNRKPWDQVPDTVRIDPDDARERGNLYKCMSYMVLWASGPTAGKPSVVWALRPSNAYEYAALTCVGDLTELPEILQLSGPLSAFYDAWHNLVPDKLTNTYAAKGDSGRGEPADSIYMPCIAAVNVCMDKKTHYSFPYFKPDKKGQKK